MSLLDIVFSYWPGAEALVRRVYKSNVGIQKHFGKLKRKLLHKETTVNASEMPQIEIDSLKDCLKSLGIQNGDILIAHTSMDGLQNVNAEPLEILDLLISLVGDKGTLAMPTFPKYKKNESIPHFDYNKFIAWTGMLPNLFIKKRGATSSHLPLNTLSALGPACHDMFLEEEKAIYTYGEGTPWEYCMKNHAKVLFLGVEPFHSISESHIAEDLLQEEFPVKKWYLDQTFLVGTGGEFSEKIYRVRDLAWSRFAAEHFFQRYLIQNRLVRDVSELGISIYIVDDLSILVDNMLNCFRNGNLLGYRIPRKYRRNRREDHNKATFN